MALIHMDAPNTVMGANLKITEDLQDKCKLVYRKIDDSRYEFEGFYNPDIPDADYPDGLIALHLGSVYGGTTPFYKGTKVWNVEGSTGDTWDGKVCHNWVEVWNIATKNKYYPKCYVSENNNCGTGIVGGHVITTCQQPSYGDNAKVFIIPICRTHNFYRNKSAMTVCERVEALILNRYHCVS